MSATTATPPRGWDTIDGPLFDYLISQVLFYEPNTAVALLQINSRSHQAAAKCLYKELYIHDEDGAVHAPPHHTRLEATLRYSHRYASLVQTLILVPAPIALQASEMCNISSFAINLPTGSQPIRPESLSTLLKCLPRLEAFVWATDRMPFHSFCSVLYNSAPHLAELLVRPTISDLAHSRHRLASQDLASYSPAPAPQRWDGFLMLNLASLRVLYISGLSIDGIRELQKLLQRATQLAVLTMDSQFVDDALLLQVAELKCIQRLLIKSSGTKMTDKGILAILESCETLQSLSLTEVEGRLQRSFWSKAAILPCAFDTLQLAFNEEGPHHSWIADHLSSVFDVLELAAGGLKVLSITRLTPKGEIFPVTHHTQEGMVLKNGNGVSMGQEMVLKRVIAAACDEVVRPRLFPAQALPHITKFGFNLETLELDMFVMSIMELKSVVESCKKLRTLRILLDAPLTKVLTMSSAFVSLTQLHTLVLSITNAHCPNQALIVKAPFNGKGPVATTTPPLGYNSSSARRPSDIASTTSSVPELSPASTHTSLAQSEPEPASPSSSPRRSIAVARRSSVGMASSVALQNFTMNTKAGFEDVAGVSVQGIQGSVGSFDTSVPPKRDIRKFARRCPSLRILRWTGRTGKGEWRIAAGSSSIHAHIDFTPIHLVEDEGSELLTLSTGADVEDFIKRKRAANLPHPGKRTFVEEMEQGVLTLKHPDKETEVTPRVDGRQFPRLRVSTSHDSHVKEVTAEASAKEASKKKGSVSEVVKHAAVTKARSAATTTSVPVTKTPKKVAKSYADISDPTQAKNYADTTSKTETKMTVLGESTRKKTGNVWIAASSPTATSGTSPVKPRTVTKVRGSEDVFSGATIIIGQGKGASSSSRAAARKGKKKVTTTIKQLDDAVATTSATESPSIKKNKDHTKKHL